MEVSEAIKLFDSMCDYEAACRACFYYVSNPNWREFCDILDDIKGKKFLEFGSATGKYTMLAAVKGFESYGIEYSRKLTKLSNEIRNQLKDRGIEYKIANGSYYVNDFLNEHGGHLYSESAKLMPAFDTYERLGIKFEDVDVFYGYLFPVEYPLVWEMFKKHAKKDATLLQVASGIFSHYEGEIGISGLKVDRATKNDVDYWIIRHD